MVFGIDPWRKEYAIEGECSKENDDWWASVDLDAIHKSCVQHIWKNGLQNWCTLLRCPSQNCVNLFPSIDVLHIDGSHSELSSCRDVNNYLPNVASGGHVWFDDVDWLTTRKAVGMVEQCCQKILTIDGKCNLYRKS
jgi:hypothetical protein